MRQSDREGGREGREGGREGRREGDAYSFYACMPCVHVMDTCLDSGIILYSHTEGDSGGGNTCVVLCRWYMNHT